MGVKLACPDKKVLLLTGDGSFLFNGKEIDTARRHGIPIVCVIGNDCAMGMDMHEQIITYGKERVIATKLNPSARYDKYAEAFDCYGELVTDPTEIKPAIKRAFESGLPAVLDVRTTSVETVADTLFSAAFNPAIYER
jgi:acetolactate synthase-1/2/3 large subunit